jgi:hypothetical protein
MSMDLGLNLAIRSRQGNITEIDITERVEILPLLDLVHIAPLL